jgi:multidrug resistance efflux pump
MYQTLTSAEQALEVAKRAVYGASTAELDRTAMELRLEEAEAKLAEVAAAQHELQLETVEEKAAEVESISAEIQQVVETTEARRDLGSWVPAGIIAAALALGGLTANLVRRRAET